MLATKFQASLSSNFIVAVRERFLHCHILLKNLQGVIADAVASKAAVTRCDQIKLIVWCQTDQIA